MIILESGTTVAGKTLSLICTVDVNIPPVVQWIYPNNTVITNSSGITVGPPVRSGNVTNFTLTFHPLLSSHGGWYTCQSDVNATSSARSSTRNITVQSELGYLMHCMCYNYWGCNCMFFFASCNFISEYQSWMNWGQSDCKPQSHPHLHCPAVAICRR